MVSVNSGLATALDDVTGALQTAGISGTTLLAMNTVTTYTVSGNQSVPQTSLLWSFQLTAPISNLGAVLGQLTTAQQAFQKQNSTLSLAFSVAGVSSSQPASCQEPPLLAMAQVQAQQVAAAAGVHAGAVLSVTTTNNAVAVQNPGFNFVQGGVFALSPVPSASFSTFGLAALGGTPVCSVNAQFQLQ